MAVNNLNFDYIGTTVANAVQSAETSLRARVTAMDPTTVSPTELLLLQQEVSKWTLMTDIQGTLVKSISDAMKGIIQKSG